MDKVLKKIERAKASLMLEYPYFGVLAASLKFSLNEDIESFLSDGDEYQYNGDYLNSLSVEEVALTLANAAMHKALSHKNRLSKRQNWLWQLATDYAVNSILVENGLKLPDRVNYDPRFEGMYAEEIYAVLKDEIRNEEYNDDEDNDTGFNESGKRKTKEEYKEEFLSKDENRPVQAVEADEEAFLENLYQKMESIGELPKGIERLFEKSEGGGIDWRSELYRYIQNHAKMDFSFYPPNMKYLYRGYALPALKSDTLKISIAIDTSASVREDLLGEFFRELELILESFPNYEIDLIEADLKVRRHRVFMSGEIIDRNFLGGGCTDFRAVFSYIEENIPDTKILIYFTDGMGIYPNKEPLFDTLWIMPAFKEVPFGDVLVMDN